ncbi:hypothetical protein ABE755_002186 [Escherichia coli]|nr:hypothetical protein [Salmonella enterica subsp. enterica serovar Enteritidis]
MGIAENLKFNNRILVVREVVLREIRSVMAIFDLDHRSVIMSILLNKTTFNIREIRRIHNGVKRRQKLSDELVRCEFIPHQVYRRIYREPYVRDKYNLWLDGRG